MAQVQGPKDGDFFIFFIFYFCFLQKYIFDLENYIHLVLDLVLENTRKLLEKY